MIILEYELINFNALIHRSLRHNLIFKNQSYQMFSHLLSLISSMVLQIREFFYLSLVVQKLNWYENY